MIKDILQQLAPLDEKIAALRGDPADENMTDITNHAAELAELSAQEDALLSGCGALTAEDRVFLARHPERPHIDETINALFTDFFEQCGDRQCREDSAILGGIARFHGMPVTVIGHRKGSTLEENMACNFGMPGPEGYRKALRLMKLAEKFSLPVFTFVDTPGAYPGIDAEERNQSEAIGRNIYELAKLRVPVISTIIGEGGSGGALAIAVCDSLIMLQYSTYSVISPEGCASILWKSADKAPEAAQALALTSDRLLELGLVDKVISEPLGGAHRDPKLMASTLRKTLVDQLKAFLTMDPDALVERRLGRLMNYGRFEEKCSSAYELLCQAAHESELPLEESAAEEPKTKEPETPKKPRRSCALRRKPVAKKSQVAETAETVAETAPKKPARRRPATRKTAAKREAPEAASAEPAKE